MSLSGLLPRKEPYTFFITRFFEDLSDVWLLEMNGLPWMLFNKLHYEKIEPRRGKRSKIALELCICIRSYTGLIRGLTNEEVSTWGPPFSGCFDSRELKHFITHGKGECTSLPNT